MIKLIVCTAFLLSLVSSELCAHHEWVHQHQVKQSYLLLKNYVGYDIPEMGNYTGLSFSGSRMWENGLIVTGAWRADIFVHNWNVGSGFFSYANGWDTENGCRYDSISSEEIKYKKVNIINNSKKYPNIGLKFGLQTRPFQNHYDKLSNGLAGDIFIEIPMSDASEWYFVVEFYLWHGKKFVTNDVYTKFGSRWLVKKRFDIDSIVPNFFPFFKVGLIAPNAPFPPIVLPVNFAFGGGLESQITKKITLIFDMQVGYTLVPGVTDSSRGFYFPTLILFGIKYSFSNTTEE